MPVQRREYTSDLSQLAPMRAFVRDACQQAWAGEPAGDAIHELELALGEATVNIILHAYEKQPGKPIEVVVEPDEDSVSVWLNHRGRSFDPTNVPPPNFDGSKESGFGVYLIRQLVDEVRYYQDENGQCVVRLFKKNKHDRPDAGPTATDPEQE
jgi:serine/threonine-protein kinase RsbW